MSLVRAMAEVEAENICTGDKQRADSLERGCRWSQRGHDLGLPMASHLLAWIPKVGDSK